VFAIADDGTPRAELALTAAKNQTATAGSELSADLGSVTGGVTDATGYHARVQWGDGTVPADAGVDGSGAISGTHTNAQPGTYTVHVTIEQPGTDPSTGTATYINRSRPIALSPGDNAVINCDDTGCSTGVL